ncbi:hypothetical protein ASZ78_010276 [Callipepla squamata]|uniref:Zinc finger FYVE domain-containing protein 26 n=1 Tax=Callipepla squamata TaxID=9009 RepID=A0A226NH97_CALSU|nr:hypothetical protein ASZ78_010276 [Callipepla squamata]
MMTLFSDHKEASSWKTAYFYCLSSSKHFLEQILVTALTLLKREDFSGLSSLLRREFNPLSRLLLLLGWTHCQSLESAKTLLWTLHKTQDLCNDSVLKDFCDGLWAQVEVLEWCIQQNSITIPRKVLLQHLHSLDCHTAIYSLHHLTDLLTLNEEDVIELLQKVPARDQQLQDCSPVFSQYLVKCHQFLRSVPVPLRLEVLENIFSLLFVSYSDLHSENVLPEDYAEDDDLDKKSSAVSVESSTSRRSSASESPQHLIKAEKKLAARTVHSNTQSLPDLELCGKSCESSKLNYPDLKHFTSSVTGFLVDDVAMDAFLTLLLNHLEEIQSSLPWDSSNVVREELELVECLNLSASRDGFGSRVLQFSKYLSEAHWRYKVVMSNRNADGKEETSSPSWESTSSELSASTSEGSTSNVSGSSDSESRARSQLQNPLIPMMLSPPESLLVSCVLRGNFMEAHQVALMFNLDSSPCYGELVFMERYQEAVREMARVEHNIENQVSDGTGGIRRSSSGRSTLQAIGNAAAAGMVFYSISDVTDKLLATSGSLAPTLQENFWISNIQLEHTDPLWEVLEDLSPSAMAAFDLACTQCHLWKTCKQLLETAERKLYNSLETRGHRPDFVVLRSESMKGFPAFLQQISKILNYSCASQGQSKSELSEEKIGSYFRCSIVDLLQACYPALTEESITNEIILSQNLDQILRALTHVERSVDSKGSLLGTLVEQASLKPVELEKHLVWNQTQLLLRTLDQHFQILPESNVNTNFVKIFFDYITTLAAVVLRSLNAELGKDGWQYLFPVKNATLRSVLALRCLDKWPLDACLEILNYCISELDITDELKADLQSRKKELQVYQKILNLQNEPLWSDWQDLKKACTDDPQAIMNIILKAKDYELCEEWGHLYPVPREDLISLHRDHLLHLLEIGDMEKASQLLQRIEDPGICLAISEQSLDQRPSLAASHFLADYLTTHFYRNLTTARRNEIQALYMGSKVLLTLPELSRVNYFHLSSRPLLMVEQLLMNMKVDWVSVAVQTLHQLLGGQEVGFAVEEIDNLLSKYAEKALDFPFSLKERRSDSVIRIQESLCQVLESEPMSKSGSSELSLASLTGVTISASPRESLQQNLSQEFVPPEKPPPKQQWIPDDTETICMVCKTERFTMVRSKN